MRTIERFRSDSRYFRSSRSRIRLFGCALALLLAIAACDEEVAETGWENIQTPDFSGPQPGIDEPGARMWQQAGSFYPEDPVKLYQNVVGLMRDTGVTVRRAAAAVLTPHASLRYSGVVQAEVFARIEVPDVVIVLASDHELEGQPFAVWGQGPWLIPGYRVPVRADLVAALLARFPALSADEPPFMGHPAELQVLFVPYINPDAQVVVVAFHDNSYNHFKDWSHERVEEAGAQLAGFIGELETAGEEVLLLTTTDLVHREPLEIARARDATLAQYVAALDVRGLYDYVTGESISICGEIPTAVMMATLRALGHESMEIVAESDSYEKNGNAESVTGYLGGITWK
jgi:hypothetical protein